MCGIEPEMVDEGHILTMRLSLVKSDYQ